MEKDILRKIYDRLGLMFYWMFVFGIMILVFLDNLINSLK